MARTLRLFTFAALALALAACGVQAPVTQPPAATATPAPLPTPQAVSSPLTEGFEGDLAGWQVGADVPQDPNRPGEEIAWSVEPGDEQASAGSRSLRLRLDGLQDDGTIWLARPLAVQPGAPRTVRLSFDLWSASESANTLANVAAYAGGRAPEAEGDFDLSQPANQAAGWQRYSYSLTAEPGPGDVHGDVRVDVVGDFLAVVDGPGQEFPLRHLPSP